MTPSISKKGVNSKNRRDCLVNCKWAKKDMKNNAIRLSMKVRPWSKTPAEEKKVLGVREIQWKRETKDRGPGKW